MIKKAFYENRIGIAGKDFFSIFSYDFISGDRQSALSDPGTVVITRSTADKYFGDTNVIGKSLEIEQFNTMPGFRIEINAANNPLTIRIFEPLEIEIPGDGSVYHRLIFSAGNEAEGGPPQCFHLSGNQKFIRYGN